MIEIDLMGISLKFETNETIFSPSNIDMGTIAMLSQMDIKENDKVLDLGCGYGIVGILISKLIGAEKVVMCDISDNAIELSRKNALINEVNELMIVKSDGLDNVTDHDFTLILSNPPYHTDFSVPKNFIEKGYKKLIFGGRMIMVTKRKDWYKNKLTTIFGGVKVVEINGYYVFVAIKREKKKTNSAPQKSNHLSKKLQRKQKKYK